MGFVESVAIGRVLIAPFGTVAFFIITQSSPLEKVALALLVLTK